MSNYPCTHIYLCELHTCFILIHVRWSRCLHLTQMVSVKITWCFCCIAFYDLFLKDLLPKCRIASYQAGEKSPRVSVSCDPVMWRFTWKKVAVRDDLLTPWNLDIWGCNIYIYMMFPKIGWKNPKMDGENNGKPYWNGWFGGTPIFGNTHIYII